MREIKFRAWDKKHKKIAQVYTLGLTGIEGTTICVGNELYSGCGKDNIELMQYTGLKDKNGKEIYEGDIIKITNEFDEKINIQEIKWDNDITGYILYVDGINEYDVIGLGQ